MLRKSPGGGLREVTGGVRSGGTFFDIRYGYLESLTLTIYFITF